MNVEKRFKQLSVCLIFTGIATNPFTLGYIFSPNGRIHSISLILFILFIELFIIIGGTIFFKKRRTVDQKTFLFSIITVAIVIVAVEVGLHILQYALHPADPGNIHKRALLSIYKDKEWAVPLLQENESLQTEYDQYLGWRTKEFHGKFITVDKSGIRQTHNPVHQPPDTTETIYVFGGSAVWGSYVRDESTIPSYLSRMLHQQSRQFIVYNYGERGYTFTQNIIHLVLLLREGHIPNRVIFYDGANDVISAYFTGRAETNGLDYEVSKAFEWKRQATMKQIGLIMKEYLEKHFMIYAGIKKLSLVLFRETQPGWAAKNYGEPEIEELSRKIVDHYVASLHLLEKLSSVYQFDYVCVLQPVIFTKAHVTDEEQNVDIIAGDQKLKKLYLDTYKLLATSHLPKFYNLSAIFDKSEGMVYSDYCHLSEEGNQMVANKLSEIILQEQ